MFMKSLGRLPVYRVRIKSNYLFISMYIVYIRIKFVFFKKGCYCRFQAPF